MAKKKRAHWALFFFAYAKIIIVLAPIIAEGMTSYRFTWLKFKLGKKNDELTFNQYLSVVGKNYSK